MSMKNVDFKSPKDIFSTQLLKKFIKNKIKNKILFNYALTLFDKKKVGKKKNRFFKFSSTVDISFEVSFIVFNQSY